MQPGQSAGDVATTLRDTGVVASRTAFLEVANADERARSLQPGTYRLREQMSAASAFELLLDPASRVVARVTIPEGSTVAEILPRIDESTDIPLADLEAAVADPASLGLPAYAEGNPEGYLFPATYDVQPGTTAAQLLTTMVDRFEQAAAAVDLEARSADLGYTPHDVVTVASLIEKEVRLERELPQVARVVYNRLDEGMPLQFDSTVNYVLPERRGRLSLDDIAVDSPYNTYENSGLPPTPISNPGEATLEAALTPAEGDYVYFVTVAPDGSSLFTADYDEFLRAKARSQAEGIY